jgi:hypothetical protein
MPWSGRGLAAFPAQRDGQNKFSCAATFAAFRVFRALPGKLELVSIDEAAKFATAA